MKGEMHQIKCNASSSKIILLPGRSIAKKKSIVFTNRVGILFYKNNAEKTKSKKKHHFRKNIF